MVKVRAWCLLFVLVCLVSAAAGAETRGVWMDKTELYWDKQEIIKLLDDLKAANFNTIYLCSYYQALVPYPNSQLLPQDPQLTGRDVFNWLIPECNKRGFRVEAWIQYGFYAFYTLNARQEKTRGTLLDNHMSTPAINNKGTPYLHNPQRGDFYCLCPSNPQSHKILIDVLSEIISRYDFDGLNLDCIEYPGDDFCFCPACQREFKKDTDMELKQYEPGSAGYKAFMTWRKERINKFMEKLSAEIRKLKPGIAITAAVVPPQEMDSKGQDWYTWLKQGYVDAVMPMLCQKDINRPLKEILSNTPATAAIFYGLDAHSNSAELLVQQIQELQAIGAKGISLWYMGKIRDDLPLLKETVFKNPAEPFIVFKNPVTSIPATATNHNQ